MGPFETSERGVRAGTCGMEAAGRVGIEPVGRQLFQASEASCALVRSPGSQRIASQQRPAAKRISPRRAEPQLCNSLGSRR